MKEEFIKSRLIGWNFSLTSMELLQITFWAAPLCRSHIRRSNFAGEGETK